VKRSKVEPGLDDRLGDALLHIQLWRCHQCGQCTPVCPSRKQGGIHIRDVMERAHLEAIDLAVDKQIWQCTLCNSCSERCQLGVDPAHVITILRAEAAARGNLPQHFKEEAKLFASSGMSFPRTGLTRKMRKEFGLEDLEVSPETMEELGRILARTRLGRVKVE
jgi:heterodisulfide reductase subunit C